MDRKVYRYQINNNGEFVVEEGYVIKGFLHSAYFETGSLTPSQQRKKCALNEGEVTGANAVWFYEPNEKLAKQLIIEHLREQVNHYNKLIENLNTKIELLKEDDS